MFQKGQSGNPGGRPKQDTDLKKLAREHTKLAISALVAVCKKGPPQARVSAAVALLDRGYGKPVQALASDPDNPFVSVQMTLSEYKAQAAARLAAAQGTIETFEGDTAAPDV